jgi:hypothetical protein
MLDNGEFLRGAADAGDLRVNPAEASMAVDKLAKVKDRLQALLNTMETTSGGMTLQLGNNSVGMAMAQKSQSKTSGGESLHAAVERLLTQATNAHYAVSKAMQNYDYTDHAGALRFRPEH